MRKFALTAGAMLALAGLTVSAVVAAPQGKKAPAGKTAEAPKCPVCKMSLSPKKTKENTVAVKIAGKTWYCCGKCDMKKAKGGRKS